jgi:hypothetical protein
VQVCGYIEANPSAYNLGANTSLGANGSAAEPVWCNAGYQCAVNTFNGAGGCCVNPQTCFYHTGCVPYTSMGSCGEACLLDNFVTKW